MRIAEIFHSIQGEGELTGVPSVFVRTSGCNLRCAWCDTPYASWHPEGGEMSSDRIVEQVLASGCRHVVLTGGEPMIAPGIRELARSLTSHGLHLTIETAGTVAPEGIACHLASLSPKLANSTPLPGQFGDGWHRRHEAARLQPGILTQWLDAGPYQLKFVVAGPADLAEIRDLLARLGRPVPPASVLLMPEGTTPAAMAAKRDFVLAACLESGYRYCHRLHLDLFGNTKGT